LQAQFEESIKKVDGKQYSVVDSMLQRANDPITKVVMELAFPPKFRVPQIDPYDRSKDLGDHVEMNKAHTSFLRSLDEIICQSFPLTLKRLARR
jgi:hypothetical protein